MKYTMRSNIKRNNIEKGVLRFWSIRRNSKRKKVGRKVTS